MNAIKMASYMLWACSLTICINAQAQAKTITPVTAPLSKESSSPVPNIKVMFTPEDNVQAELVRVLSGARKQILVQAYLLTDNIISDALIAAHKRGVKVRVLVDAVREREAKGSDAQRLANAGIMVRLETRYENAHNKVIIIDKNLVVTGSYNFTYAAQHKNAENVLFIKNTPQIVAQFTENWHQHHVHAVDLKSF